LPLRPSFGLIVQPEQGAAVLVHPVALDLDAVRRTHAGLDEGDREADVFQAQVAQGL
jgi:hypothetical protein